MTVRAIGLAASLLLTVSIAAACGSAVPSTTPATTTPPSSAPTASASATVESAEPVETLPEETVGPPLAGQTETEWGRIWDSLPTGFPTFPDAVPSEEAASGPATAVLVVEGSDPRAIATWYQEQFEIASFGTEALSGPLEDGGFVLDSIGQDPACRLSVTIAPLGGLTTLTVMYGASCPHD